MMSIVPPRVSVSTSCRFSVARLREKVASLIHSTLLVSLECGLQIIHRIEGQSQFRLRLRHQIPLWKQDGLWILRSNLSMLMLEKGLVVKPNDVRVDASETACAHAEVPVNIFELQLRSIVGSGILFGSHGQCIPCSVVLRVQIEAFLA
jgi:hypothetical protein